MDSVGRNVLLAVNGALLLLLVACGGWIWRSQRLAEETGDRRASTSYEVFIVDKLGALRLVGLKLPKVVLTSIEGETISTDLSLRKGGLVLFFKPQSCQACLITQLKGLQRVYEALEDTAELAVLAVGEAPRITLKRFSRAFGLTYPIASDTTGALLAAELSGTTPAVLLVNSQNTIIDNHYPSPGRPELSLLYYNELGLGPRLGVRLSGERLDLGLGGTPILDVIRNDFGAPSAEAQKLLH